MRPIIYEPTEKNFKSNGLGRLPECECLVTEERNGVYELELECNAFSENADLLACRRIVLAKVADGTTQPFDLYSVVKNMGTIKAKGRHVSYRLSGMPFLRTSTRYTGTAAFMASFPANVPFDTNALDATQRLDIGFTFETDSTDTVQYAQETNKSIRAILLGSEGSILDKVGGEYEFDRFAVKHHMSRGKDNGVVVRYGKNLLTLEHDSDTDGTCNGAMCVWINGDTYKRGTSAYYKTDVIPYPYLEIYDVTNSLSTEPTNAQLDTLASNMLNSLQDEPNLSVSVTFASLADSEEFNELAPLERVNLCDTVRIINKQMGVDVKTKVVKIVYDSVRERYEDVTLGTIKQTLADTILNR